MKLIKAIKELTGAIKENAAAIKGFARSLSDDANVKVNVNLDLFGPKTADFRHKKRDARGRFCI